MSSDTKPQDISHLWPGPRQLAASAGELSSILLTQPPTANMGTQGGSNIIQGLRIWSSENFDMVLHTCITIGDLGNYGW